MLFFPQWNYPTVPGNPRNRYTLCNKDIQGSNFWLRGKEVIPVGEVQRVDVTVKYSSSPCILPSDSVCNESFFAYVWESNKSVTRDKIPNPISSFGSYRKFATINLQATNQPSSLTIPLRINSKFIVLGFRDQGGCRTLYSVKVTYRVCPERTLNNSLVSLPKTLAPFNLQSIPVNGSCTANSFQAVEGSLSVLCESTGEWNTSTLQGKCVCKENMENNGGICKGTIF